VFTGSRIGLPVATMRSGAIPPGRGGFRAGAVDHDGHGIEGWVGAHPPQDPAQPYIARISRSSTFRVRRPLAELRERRGAGLSTTPHPVTDTRNTAVVAAAISGASSTTTAVIKEDQPGRG
jgi:hypothetical protein